MEPAPNPSMLTTSLVATLGSIPASLAVAWLGTKGLALNDLQQAALTTGGGVAIGAATGWVVAILNSFTQAVVVVNAALANRFTGWVNKLGGTQ